MDEAESVRVKELQDTIGSLWRIVGKFLDDHKRLPRDAWPSPEDPMRWECRCALCEEARAALREEVGYG